MYVAVKGGQKAIAAAHALLAKARRGDESIAEIGADQIRSQLALAVDRVQAEGSLWAPDLAARAVKQARGDLVEAAFLLRAHRSTLKRLGYGEPIDSRRIMPARRISATFKDLPGGQILGPTFDYTHRLLDPAGPEPGGDGGLDDGGLGGGDFGDEDFGDENFGDEEFGDEEFGDGGFGDGLGGGGLDAGGRRPGSGGPPPGPEAAGAPGGPASGGGGLSKASPPEPDSLLAAEGLMEPDEPLTGPPGDLTRRPLDFPAERRLRLQSLARADEGFLLGLAYSCQRGWGAGQHPFVTSLKLGAAEVELSVPELGFPVAVARVELTEVTTATASTEAGSGPARLTKGYGLTLGSNERKALAMAIVDRAMRSGELGERIKGPAQDPEFVLAHGDNVEASGFVSHLKLPHHVDFQSDLLMLRRMRDEAAAPGRGGDGRGHDGRAQESRARDGSAKKEGR